MSTLVLILKSLAPFLKEMILKDKGLRDLITGNKVASTLSACLITVVVLFIYATDVADNYSNEVAQLTREKKWVEGQLAEKNGRIQYLEGRLFGETPPPLTPPPEPIASPVDYPTTPPSNVPAPEQRAVPPPPTTGPSNKGNKPPRKKVEDSDLKSYTKSLLDQL